MLQYTTYWRFYVRTDLGCVAGSAASSVSDTWLMRLGSDTAELPAAATWAASPDTGFGFENIYLDLKICLTMLALN